MLKVSNNKTLHDGVSTIRSTYETDLLNNYSLMAQNHMSSINSDNVNYKFINH